MEFCEFPDCVLGEKPSWCGFCTDEAHPMRPENENRFPGEALKAARQELDKEK